MQLLNLLSLLLLTQSCYGTLRHNNNRRQLRSTGSTSTESKENVVVESKRSTQCGTSICSTDEFCCNESCSMCAPVGSMCTQQYCETTVEESDMEESKEEYKNEIIKEDKELKNEEEEYKKEIEEEEKEKEEKEEKDDTKKHDNNDDESKCGNTSICSVDEYCCNPSCGICAPINGNCITLVCNENDDSIVLSSDVPSLSPSDIPSLLSSDVPSMTPSSLSKIESKLDSDTTHTNITSRCFNMTT